MFVLFGHFFNYTHILLLSIGTGLPHVDLNKGIGKFGDDKMPNVPALGAPANNMQLGVDKQLASFMNDIHLDEGHFSFSKSYHHFVYVAPFFDIGHCMNIFNFHVTSQPWENFLLTVHKNKTSFTLSAHVSLIFLHM